MPKGCVPCPFPSFPPLPAPCPPRMIVPTYQVPGPFCCEPELPVPPMHGCYEDHSGLSDCSGSHHGYMMAPCPCPMPHKMMVHHHPMHHHMPKPHHKAPWVADWMRETELEIGGGMEIEKPNMLGNWLGHMADWMGKGGGAEAGMGMDGGSKWGNWLGKGADGGMEAGGGGQYPAGGGQPGGGQYPPGGGQYPGGGADGGMWHGGTKRPMGHMPGKGMGGGKMSNWMNKGAGDGSGMPPGDQGGMDDGSGKKLWPK